MGFAGIIPQALLPTLLASQQNQQGGMPITTSDGSVVGNPQAPTPPANPFGAMPSGNVLQSILNGGSTPWMQGSNPFSVVPPGSFSPDPTSMLPTMGGSLAPSYRSSDDYESTPTGSGALSAEDQAKLDLWKKYTDPQFEGIDDENEDQWKTVRDATKTWEERAQAFKDAVPNTNGVEDPGDAMYNWVKGGGPDKANVKPAGPVDSAGNPLDLSGNPTVPLPAPNGPSAMASGNYLGLLNDVVKAHVGGASEGDEDTPKGQIGDATIPDGERQAYWDPTTNTPTRGKIYTEPDGLGGWVNLPGSVSGTPVSEQDAIAAYQSDPTKHLGTYDTKTNALRAAARQDDTTDPDYVMAAVRHFQDAQHQALMQAANVALPNHPTGIPSKGVLPWLGLGSVIAQALAGKHSDVGAQILNGFLKGTEQGQNVQYQNAVDSQNRQKALYLENARLAGVDADDALKAYNLREQESNAEDASDRQEDADEQAQTNRFNAQLGQARSKADVDRVQADWQQYDTYPGDGRFDAKRQEISSSDRAGGLTEYESYLQGFKSPDGEIDPIYEDRIKDKQAQLLKEHPSLKPEDFGEIPTRANIVRHLADANGARLQGAFGWLPSGTRSGFASGLAQVQYWRAHARMALSKHNLGSAAVSASYAGAAGDRVNHAINQETAALRGVLAGQVAQVQALRARNPNDPALAATAAHIQSTQRKIRQLQGLTQSTPAGGWAAG